MLKNRLFAEVPDPVPTNRAPVRQYYTGCKTHGLRDWYKWTAQEAKTPWAREAALASAAAYDAGLDHAWEELRRVNATRDTIAPYTAIGYFEKFAPDGVDPIAFGQGGNDAVREWLRTILGSPVV